MAIQATSKRIRASKGVLPVAPVAAAGSSRGSAEASGRSYDNDNGRQPSVNTMLGAAFQALTWEKVRGSRRYLSRRACLC